jgi:prepilin signal peptidase PulO-like enzyme (type II secretory pathway)
MGDVRLLGAMGLVLGPYVLLAYTLANILGVFGAVPALLRARARAREMAAGGSRRVKPEPASIPFGPFLSAAGILTALWGPQMWAAYLRLLGIGA